MFIILLHHYLELFHISNKFYLVDFISQLFHSENDHLCLILFIASSVMNHMHGLTQRRVHLWSHYHVYNQHPHEHSLYQQHIKNTPSDLIVDRPSSVSVLRHPTYPFLILNQTQLDFKTNNISKYTKICTSNISEKREKKL